LSIPFCRYVRQAIEAFASSFVFLIAACCQDSNQICPIHRQIKKIREIFFDLFLICVFSDIFVMSKKGGFVK